MELERVTRWLTTIPMRIRTILNRCHYLKSFMYEKEQIEVINGREALGRGGGATQERASDLFRLWW